MTTEAQEDPATPASPASPRPATGWFGELVRYLTLVVLGGVLALASSYLMRKFGL